MTQYQPDDNRSGQWLEVLQQRHDLTPEKGMIPARVILRAIERADEDEEEYLELHHREQFPDLDQAARLSTRQRAEAKANWRKRLDEETASGAIDHMHPPRHGRQASEIRRGMVFFGGDSGALKYLANPTKISENRKAAGDTPVKRRTPGHQLRDIDRKSVPASASTAWPTVLQRSP